LRGTSVLVTGGAGFLGSYLVNELLARGAAVRILDNQTAKRRGLIQVPNRSVQMVEGDVRNAIACRNACRGMDMVFHLAALTSIPASIVDPVASDGVNIGGTLNMLIAARESRVKRFVFASTAAVYGDCLSPLDEDAAVKPLSPHSVGKLYGEQMCRLYADLYRLNTVSLRITQLYGPGQSGVGDRATVIPAFLAQMLDDSPVSMEGGGQQTRDFLHVRDAARGLLLAAEKEAAGGVFNLASGSSITVRELFAALRKLVPTPHAPIKVQVRAGDVRQMRLDTGWARKTLGFEAEADFKEGLREVVAGVRSQSADEIDGEYPPVRPAFVAR
jgi:nucleoside-diphosphate-sugar epimerase